MEITTSRYFISALHHVFEQAHPGPAQPHAARIMAKALAEGWITPAEIENLLLATDPRLWQMTTIDLLSVFGIETQSVFVRPARGAHDVEGLNRVSVVDLARLLILLERSGMAIDPMPLVSALAPTLGAKRLLTEPELMVHWRAQGHHGAGIRFVTSRPEIGCAGPSMTTASGYRASGFYEGDPECDQGEARPDVVMLLVAPPADPSFRPAQVRSGPGRRHLRKYLGEPRFVHPPAPPPKRRRRPTRPAA